MSFDVTIINDNVLGDDDETFLLAIANSSLSNHGFYILTTGDYDTAMVNIVDTSSK